MRGQALIETAITLPIMILLFIGFLAVGVAAEAYVDLNTAVYLAAASEATAPAGDPTGAAVYANDTFTNTIKHDPWVTGYTVNCADSGAAGAQIACTGSAQLHFGNTPLSILFAFFRPTDLTLNATATSTRSPFRSFVVNGSP